MNALLRASTISIPWSFTASPSFALVCKPIDPDRVASEAEIAFVGRAISVVASDYSPSRICWTAEARGAHCGGKIATFDVTKTLRGSASGQVRVLAEDACYCLGGYFKEGDEYLVIGVKNPTSFPADFLAKDVCWGTGSVQRDLSKKIIDRLSNERQ